MITKKITRVFFLIKDNQRVKLEDINPLLSVNEIIELYSNQYPELINASISNKGIIDDELVFEFSTIAGTKG